MEFAGMFVAVSFRIRTGTTKRSLPWMKQKAATHSKG